ncbi:MAG: phosphopentomutase [Acidobacteriaceae bacterium]|nr:phosphopentomutase [Acidobacteriaceae bacterium]MBV9500757.1 phosphopentomutase [Acidobacteriaceae bacterium]
MPRFNRVIWIVLDSVGIGAMPDARVYGDEGSDTLGNIARRIKLELPNLCRFGLGNIKPLPALCPVAHPAGAYGRCQLASPGKDTTTGHWEMAGIILKKPFPIYPHGFPPEVMAAFEARIRRKAIGNKPASGTEIIKELGEEHTRTGWPIVYTSADSVFQVAAHESVIPIEKLYHICEIARGILTGPNEVGRVIARPFEGSPGHYTRTARRHDFAVPPLPGMLLDKLAERGVPVFAIGKIYDIFLGRGIARFEKTTSNEDGMQKTLAAMREQSDGVIFVNLVDFDQLYGHRNDVQGYAGALESVDRWLSCLELQEEDLVILTADHGCDPTTPSTDHSREYTPLLIYGPRVRAGTNLSVRNSLADIGQTVAENFGTSIKAGVSFLQEI